MPDDRSVPNGESGTPTPTMDAPAEFQPVTIRSYLANEFGVRNVAATDAKPHTDSAAATTSTTVQSAPITPPADATAELAKWRERVPKLAAALKARTNQIEALQTELARLQTAGSGAGIQARDQHIEELELKLGQQTSRYQMAEGTLRAREVELEDLNADLVAWKERLQSVTVSLDEQVALVDQGQQQVQQLQAELGDSQVQLRQAAERQAETDKQLTQQHSAAAELEAQLQQQLSHQQQHNADLQQDLDDQQARNAKLLETTELANRQLETLADDLTRLRGQLSERQTELDQRGANISELQDQLATQQALLSTQDEQLMERAELLDLQDRTLAAQQQQLQEASQKLDAQQQRNLLDTAQIQAEHSDRLRDIHAQTLLVFEAVDDQYRQEASLQEQQRAEQTAQQLAQLTQAQLAGEQHWIAELNTAHTVAQGYARQMHLARQEREQQAQRHQRQADAWAAHLQAHEAIDGVQFESEMAAVVATRVAEIQSTQAASLATAVAQERDQANAKLAKLQSALEHQAQQQALELAAQAERMRAQANTQVQHLSEQRDALQAQLRQVQQQLESHESMPVEEPPRISILGEVSDGLAPALNPTDDAQAPFYQCANAVTTAEPNIEQDKIAELEALLQQRNDELSQALSTQSQSVEANAPDDIRVDGLAISAKPGLNEKMLVVLNQQLADTREENDRLREQLTKTRESIRANDDLTRLKGVGAKLAEQLRDYGISRFAEVAALDLELLEDPEHPLFNLRARIARDGWIEQAQSLI